MRRNVYLQGDLGDRFGHKFVMDADNCVDIIKCITANRPEFKPHLIYCADNNIDIDVQFHDQTFETKEDALRPLGEGDVTITAIPSGGKDAAEKIFAAILIVLAFKFGGQTLGLLDAAGKFTNFGLVVAGVGINLGISGLFQLLADDPEADENPNNYLYAGDAHLIDEGDPVPVLYGELLVPGTPIAFNVTNGKHHNAQQLIEADGAILAHYIGQG